MVIKIRDKGCRKADLWNLLGQYFMAALNRSLNGVVRYNFFVSYNWHTHLWDKLRNLGKDK